MSICFRIFSCLLAMGALLATAVACSGEESADEISPVEARDTENDQDGANEPDTNDADGSTTTTTTTTVVEIAPGVTVAPGIEVPPTSPTTIPSPPPDDPQAAELFEAYRASYDALGEAMRRQDPDFPGLEDTATGRHLERLRGFVTEHAAENVVGLIPAGTASELTYSAHILINNNHALLNVCLSDDSIGLNVATGEIIDEGLETDPLETELRKVDGTWKVELVRTGIDSSTCK